MLTDVTTVEEIVETMEGRYGLAWRMWVMDRGLLSEETLTWLRGGGRRYLVGTPKSKRRRWARQLAESRDWQAVREGIEAKRCVGPEGRENFVLVFSVDRRKKERTIHARFSERIEAGLTRLAGRLQRARGPLERARLERQLGRLLGRNSRAGRSAVDLVPAGLRLVWTARPEWDDWARWSEEC